MKITIYRAVLLILGFLCISTMLWAKTLCVDVNTKATQHNGSCWESPFLSLQDALDAASSDLKVDQIWIAKGVYHPTKTYAPQNLQGKTVVGGAFSQQGPGITFKKQTISYADNPRKYNEHLKTFQLIDGVSIYGGFKGHEKTPQDRPRPSREYATILDGNVGKLSVWHVLSAGNDLTQKGVMLTLDRIIIRNGQAQNAPYFPTHFPLNKAQVPIYYHDDGAGLYVFARSDITLNQVIFTENHAIAGGAIYVQDGSTLTINQCEFNHNHALNGAAINARNGGPNEFSNNAKRHTTVVIKKSLFIHNSSKLSPAIFANDTQLTPPSSVKTQRIFYFQPVHR
jgi:predicted outer membrane repeat protein